MVTLPYSTIVCAVEGAVATLTLNRPDKLNALNATMFDELEHAVAALQEDPAVRAIVVTGSGERAFAAGADIRGLLDTDAESGEALSQRGQKVFDDIAASKKPVIAAVNEVALGGGCELALACHVRIAAENAKFGLPEVKLGLVPGYGGSQRLPRLVGEGRAVAMMLTAEPVDAVTALSYGLVTAVHPAAELQAAAKALAEKIAAVAPLAVEGVLETVRKGRALRLDEAQRVESGVFGRLSGTTDKREGVTAFLEKRAPVWRGV